MEHVKTASPIVNYQDLMADQIRWVFVLLHMYANFNIKNCNSFNDIINSIIYDENIDTLSAQLNDLFINATTIPNSPINTDPLIPVKDAITVQDLCGIGLSNTQYIDNTLSYLNYIQHLMCMIALLKKNGFPVSNEISSQITPLIQNVADLVSDDKSCEVFFWALYETYL